MPLTRDPVAPEARSIHLQAFKASTLHSVQVLQKHKYNPSNSFFSQFLHWFYFNLFKFEKDISRNSCSLPELFHANPQNLELKTSNWIFQVKHVDLNLLRAVIWISKIKGEIRLVMILWTLKIIKFVESGFALCPAFTLRKGQSTQSAQICQTSQHFQSRAVWKVGIQRDRKEKANYRRD